MNVKIRGMEKVAVIIPAFNEAANIKGLIEEVINIRPSVDAQLDIIVVNDGSDDRTAAIASGLNCSLLDLPINLGIGGAVQTGMRYAYENGYQFAVQVDGDGQHPPAEIAKLIKAARQSGADVVIGSRFMKKEGFKSTVLRRIGIRYFSLLIKIFSGTYVTDCTSGFRLMDRKAMALVNEYYPDQYPEPESLLIFALKGLKIAETPVVMRARMGGESSIRNFGAVYYMVKVSLAIFFGFIKYKSWAI